MLNLCACLLLAAAFLDEPFQEWTPTAASPSSEAARTPLSPEEVAQLIANSPPLPFDNPTSGAKATTGAIWLAAPQGVMLLEPGAARWRLFHSRRWLPQGEVRSLQLDGADGVQVETTGGKGRLSQRAWTPRHKADAVLKQLRERNVLRGFVSESELNNADEPSAGHFQPSSDNDGLWTSMYVAAEAFRYGATGAEDARANAQQSLNALFELERITGSPGFVARSIVPSSEPDPTERYGGHWVRSADDKWWWKSDTSSDELVGHYFAYSVYYDLVADESEKLALRGTVQRITDRILKDDFNYLDPDGKRTTWGFWGPRDLNHNLEHIDERGLNSLELLMFLEVAHHIVGGPRYAEVAKDLIDQHAYATNTLQQKLLGPVEWINHSDDELAFLSYYPLLRYERDPALRKIYLASLERSWIIEQPERSPLFNLIFGAALQGERHADPARRPAQRHVSPERYDQAACLEWFRDAPADTRYWAIQNSMRKDLGPLQKDRFGRVRSLQVLPVSERPVMKWNGDPYVLDGGGDGRTCDDGTFYLLPLWLGEYHRLLD